MKVLMTFSWVMVQASKLLTLVLLNSLLLLSLFFLSNVLCVLSIRKNLISVSKLCKTNNASIEFFFSSFVVKDLKKRARLTQWRSKDDVYEWPWPNRGNAMGTSPKQARVSVKTSLANWHHRLGHPSSHIFQFLIRKHNLPIYPIDSFHSFFWVMFM